MSWLQHVTVSGSEKHMRTDAYMGKLIWFETESAGTLIMNLILVSDA